MFSANKVSLIGLSLHPFASPLSPSPQSCHSEVVSDRCDVRESPGGEGGEGRGRGREM